MLFVDKGSGLCAYTQKKGEQFASGNAKIWESTNTAHLRQ